MDIARSKSEIDLNEQSAAGFSKPGFSKYLLLVIYFMSIFTFKEGTVQLIAIGIILLCMGILIFYDEFYLVLPILIFFYMYLSIPGGVSLFRIYTILFIIKAINKKIDMDLLFVPPLLVIALYSIFVLFPIDLQMALFIIFDMVFIMLYIKTSLLEKDMFDSFFKYYVLAAICTTVFGFLRMALQWKTAVYIEGEWIYVTRFIATYNDPNYLGFFYNVAIFAAVSLNMFRNFAAKFCVIIILYSALIATLSITALICNVIGIFIYLLLAKKINIKTLIAIAIGIQLSVFGYHYALENPIEGITDAAYKVESKLNDLKDKDMGSLTTNRSDIWEEHFDIYKNQSNLKILFGGNVVNSYMRDDNKFSKVSHQDFLDMLLNLGLVGTLIMMLFYFINTKNKFLSFLRDRSEEDIMSLLIKYIWFFYAFSLTMFPAWMFYLFFFL